MEIQHLVEDADISHKSSLAGKGLGGQAAGRREEEGAKRD
jgi:hypothetical protein